MEGISSAAHDWRVNRNQLWNGPGSAIIDACLAMRSMAPSYQSGRSVFGGM